jgi:hypothetical protein
MAGSYANRNCELVEGIYHAMSMLEQGIEGIYHAMSMLEQGTEVK